MAIRGRWHEDNRLRGSVHEVHGASSRPNPGDPSSAAESDNPEATVDRQLAKQSAPFVDVDDQARSDLSVARAKRLHPPLELPRRRQSFTVGHRELGGRWLLHTDSLERDRESINESGRPGESVEGRR